MRLLGILALSGLLTLAAGFGCTTTARRAPTPTEEPAATATAVPPSATSTPSSTASRTITGTPTDSRTVTLTPTATETRTQTNTFTLSSPSPTYQPTRFVYVAGGQGSGGSQDTVYSAYVGTGAIGSFTTGAPLTTRRNGVALAWSGGYLYAVGGSQYGVGASPTAIYPDVLSAPASAGVVGAFVQRTPLPGIRSNASLSADGSNLYLLGGFDTWTTATSSTYVTTFASGVTGGWTSAQAFPAPRAAYGLERIGANLFAVSGYGSGASVAQASATGGTIGAWNATLPLPASRYYHATALWGDYVYCLGGFTTGLTDEVWMRHLGTSDPWVSVTQLPAPVGGHAAFAFNGSVYVVGGYTSSYQTTVWRAPINPDYTLGTWTAAGSLPAARAYHALAVGD